MRFTKKEYERLRFYADRVANQSSPEKPSWWSDKYYDSFVTILRQHYAMQFPHYRWCLRSSLSNFVLDCGYILGECCLAYKTCHQCNMFLHISRFKSSRRYPTLCKECNEFNEAKSISRQKLKYFGITNDFLNDEIIELKATLLISNRKLKQLTL